VGPRIDLRHETGLRIFIGQKENRTEMLLLFHHACCDGFGAMRFVEDLLAAYHNAITRGSQKISLPPVDFGRLRTRGKFGMNPVKYLLRAHKELVGALGTLEYFVTRPVPLTPGDDGASGRLAGDEFPASCAHTFTVSETEKLRRATRKIGCTVNDLLLRDLFLTLHQWRLQHDPENRARYLRIMIPINLRTPADALMPAANVVSMVPNNRKPLSLSSPRRLMNILRIEMKVCKRWRLGLSTIHVLRLARMLPGGLQWLLREDRCLATAVLSNLGELNGETALPRRDGKIVAGNTTLERAEVLPPLRPLTRTSFGAVSYAGQLTVSLTYDARHFTDRDGRRLLKGFVRRIEGSLSESG
ncbi:MAG: hypothetical protein ACYSWU_23480, partial [Planctomycetota bacterium]